MSTEDPGRLASPLTEQLGPPPEAMSDYPETGEKTYTEAALLAFGRQERAAERERWTKRVREAFNEGFSSPETYNGTLQNSADEAWEKEKAWLLRA